MTDSETVVENRCDDIGRGFLAIAAGSSDVIAFLMLGHVFVSAMTGNTALLGIAIGGGDFLQATKPLLALVGFVAGAVLASAIYRPSDDAHRRRTVLRRLMVMEIVCFAAFAIVWQMSDRPDGGGALYALILLSSVAMGVQGIAAKIIKAPGINTIVFTLTVVSIVYAATEILLRRVRDPAVKRSTWRQVAVFGAYALGVLIAGFLEWADVALLIYMPAVAICVALACFERASIGLREDAR